MRPRSSAGVEGYEEERDASEELQLDSMDEVEEGDEEERLARSDLSGEVGGDGCELDAAAAGRNSRGGERTRG